MCVQVPFVYILHTASSVTERNKSNSGLFQAFHALQLASPLTSHEIWLGLATWSYNSVNRLLRCLILSDLSAFDADELLNSFVKEIFLVFDARFLMVA